MVPVTPHSEHLEHRTESRVVGRKQFLLFGVISGGADPLGRSSCSLRSECEADLGVDLGVDLWQEPVGGFRVNPSWTRGRILVWILQTESRGLINDA